MTGADEEDSDAQLDELLAEHDPEIVRMVLQVQLDCEVVRSCRCRAEAWIQ